MKDLNKIVETETPIETPDELNKATSEIPVVKAQKVALKKVIVKAKEKPESSDLAKSDSEVPTESSTPEKVAKLNSKKATKNDTKITVVKSQKKGKAEAEAMVQNVAIIDLKDEPEPNKKQNGKIKVVKKTAKKAKEKVDKLKKKVKKAKKKEVKKSKLKGLKEKLKKAVNKLKSKAKKLKEGK